MPEIPMMYDVMTDELRPVTQEDVNNWERIARLWGSVVNAVLHGDPAPEMGALVEHQVAYHQRAINRLTR